MTEQPRPAPPGGLRGSPDPDIDTYAVAEHPPTSDGDPRLDLLAMRDHCIGLEAELAEANHRLRQAERLIRQYASRRVVRLADRAATGARRVAARRHR